MASELLNPNPTVYKVAEIKRNENYEMDENIVDGFDTLEIYDLIRKINDPEHPLTLEQLNVTKHELISLDNDRSYIKVFFTPTIPHCSMATLIGLCIRVKLLRSLPERFKVDIMVTPGTHASEEAVNKQLNDKATLASIYFTEGTVGPS
jgi:metal-sulfur cluster biosynthetic enzyme